MVEHYCAYLHHNYLPRALLMYRSLAMSGGALRLHLLCLSDQCADLIAELDLPGISAIRLDAMERHYPELLSVKAERWPMDYIFTLTPFLPSFVLDQYPEINRITYIDVDLFFYGNPTAIFEAIGNRSIAIVPHRFSPDQIADRRYGNFNVGWISYATDSIGRLCLAEYRRDCLDWCRDVPEPGRFADQGYLDSWPERYGDAVAIIWMKGINTARWNADNYVFSETDDRFFCDDEPLIFYHFQGIRQRGDGDYLVQYPRSAVPGSVLRERIYRPYLVAMRHESAALAAHFPDVTFGTALRALAPEVAEAAAALRRAVHRVGVAEVILYGAGEIGAAFLDGLADSGVRVVACVDADEKIHGTSIFGVPVMALATALNSDCRAIAIASVRYRDEIIALLTKTSPLDDLTIISIEQE
jgi:hypothetical protein